MNHVFVPDGDPAIDDVRLARHELHPAGRAAGVPAARVQLIDTGFVRQRENQTLPRRHLERAHALDR